MAVKYSLAVKRRIVGLRQIVKRQGGTYELERIHDPVNRCLF